MAPPRLSAVLTAPRRKLRDSLEAQFNIQMGLTIAAVILGAVVGLLVLAALAPTWFSATNDTVQAFATADVGEPTANSLANNVFPLILGLLGVFAIAALAFFVMKLRKG